MDCQGLRSDIEKLRNEQQKLRELMDDVQDKATVRSIEEKVDSLGDNILEKYMEDFFEENPEIVQWKGESLERLRYVYEDGDGYFSTVCSIAPTPDGGMLVGGTGEVVCEYRKEGNEWKVEQLECDLEYGNVASIVPTPDGGMLVGGGWNGVICECEKKDGGWKTKQLKKLKYMNNDGKEKLIDINVIAPTPDGGMLVGGGKGAICEYRKEGREWKTVSLERFKYVNKNGVEHYSSIYSIAVTPDGGMLVGGRDGAICEYRKEEGEWKVIPLERFAYVDGDGNKEWQNIISIAPTLDGGMLVGGSGGAICEYRKEGGEWRKKSLERFGKYVDNDGEERFCCIRTIAPTLDGGMLVGGDKGEICEYKKEGDEWRMMLLEGLKHMDEYGNEVPSSIRAIVSTPDGGMLVGGGEGALSEYIKPPRTLATLKEHLAEIVEKGEDR